MSRGQYRGMVKTAEPMKVFERRLLTPGEEALGRSVFGEEIDWPRVQLVQAPPLGFGAMAPFRHSIIFSRWRASRDFARASLSEQGWLIHEMTHLWQAARGKVLPVSKLKALGKRAYAYKPTSATFADYNIERQAEIARHLFLARAGAPEKGAPPRAWLEDIWARR